MARMVAGLVLTLVGVVWFLQGLGRFPGESFMNSQREWALIGAIVAVAGLALFAASARARRHR